MTVSFRGVCDQPSPNAPRTIGRLLSGTRQDAEPAAQIAAATLNKPARKGRVGHNNGATEAAYQNKPE
jgi:hypothetical protein